MRGDPVLKKNYHKNRAGGVAQGVGPEIKPQYCKKKKKKKKTLKTSTMLLVVMC
jgi:hypothetical protein